MLQGGVQLIVLDGQNVCAGIGNAVEQLSQAAGAVDQLDVELHPAVTGHQTLLNDVLHEADVDIAAGKNADNPLKVVEMVKKLKEKDFDCVKIANLEPKLEPINK